MAKDKTVFVCGECGYESPKWMGRCPGCNSWNTMVEEKMVRTGGASVSRGASTSVRLSKVASLPEKRVSSGIVEMDRVLGGGLIRGMVVLLGGDPGIGKSTLLLQIADHLAAEANVLYASGEESAAQIKLRAERLHVERDMHILCDTDLEGAQCASVLGKYPALPRFTDFRRMLDATAGKIDAVIVSTPDFSHFPALMDAMRRGLAVFSEKPLAHTFEECELLMAAERKYGVVTQMGNQGHSGKNYYQFKHYVETGVIDVSKLTRLVAHMNSPRRWHKWNGKVS